MADYDAIVIGTRTGGPRAGAAAGRRGWRVAIVERKLFGGTCVNTGCTPTKTAGGSAYAAHLARRAADYGVTLGGTVAVDMKAVKARKDGSSWRVAQRRRAVSEDAEGLHGLLGPRPVRRPERGRGRRRRPQGAGRSSSMSAAGAGAADPGSTKFAYLTNSSMMDVDFLPGISSCSAAAISASSSPRCIAASAARSR